MFSTQIQLIPADTAKPSLPAQPYLRRANTKTWHLSRQTRRSSPSARQLFLRRAVSHPMPYIVMEMLVIPPGICFLGSVPLCYSLRGQVRGNSHNAKGTNHYKGCFLLDFLLWGWSEATWWIFIFKSIFTLCKIYAHTTLFFLSEMFVLDFHLRNTVIWEVALSWARCLDHLAL